MTRFILMRLLGLIPVLLILSMITFILMHEVPGGPWKYGQRPFSDEQLAALKARYGLDKPLWQQYLVWIAGVVKLDFGKSAALLLAPIKSPRLTTWGLLFARLRAIEYNTGGENLGDG